MKIEADLLLRAAHVAAAGLPNIGRNVHDFVTWKPTTGGSLLCMDLVVLHRVSA
jgi:hypothetical protein